MAYMKHSIAALAAVVFAVVGATDAGAVSADNYISDFVVNAWRAADGLPGNTATEIIQDNTGYLYIGSYEGLVRFDGLKFLTLNRAYDEKYAFSSARSLLQDSRGNLWVGANEEGVVCLLADDSVRSYAIADGLPNNSIRSLVEDHDGNIWVGTAGGIAYITPDWQLVRPQGLEQYGEENILVFDLYCDAGGSVWCTTSKEHGVYRYDGERFARWPELQSFPTAVISCVMQDSDSNYWFGVEPHYAVKVSDSGETVYDLSRGSGKGTAINCIYQDRGGALWFALNTGVTILYNGELAVYDEVLGLKEGKVVSILEDREGSIWFALDRGGIQRLKPSRFKTEPLATAVNAIAEDTARNRVWLCGNNGLYCYDASRGVFEENDITRFFTGVRLRHAAYTADGRLFLSAYDGPSFVCVERNGSIRNWQVSDGLAGAKVRVSLQAANGDIYVGTTNGLTIIDGATGSLQSFTRAAGLPHDFIMCIYQDRAGDIWVGTDGGGVFVMRDRAIVASYTADDGLAGNVIFTISQLDDSDDLWICTGTGISRLHDGTLASFTSSMMHGLGSVFQLLPDGRGTLWFTSNGGIGSVKQQQIERVLDGAERAATLKSYGPSEGVMSGGVTSTAFSMVDSKGRIWFTLIDGFTIYDTARVKDQTAPTIHVQEVVVDGGIIPYRGQRIVVPPENKRLLIRYTGLGSLSPELMEFRYRLSGFESEYSEWTLDRQVSYTNLQPGRYEFTVQALSSDDVPSAVSPPLVIIRRAYPWQRTWFWLLLLVAIAGGVALLVNIRFRRMKRYQKTLQEAVERQTVELRKAVEASMAASKAKSDFLANMSHEIRTPINAVLGMDEMILRETREEHTRGYAVNIKNASNTLLALINDILDFSKIEAGKMEIINDTYDLSSVLVDLVNMIADRAEKKGLAFTIAADPAMPKLLFGDSMRLKQCVLNILTNAVKYTQKGSVTFTVSTEFVADDESTVLLHVSVSDTGIGIKAEDMEKLFSPFDRIEEERNRTIEGTGLGMSIVQKTLAMMESKLDVQSVYGEGSTFSFTVKQGVVSKEPLGDVMQSYRDSIAAMERYRETLYAPKARLLVVDDTEMNLAVVQGLLKHTGIQLDTATDGFTALNKVCRYEYDLLFIDHRMPGMDGVQTLEAMQTLVGNKCIGKPCVALTANAISGAKELYLKAGFTDYLSKPVKPEHLEAMILKYLPPELLEEPPEPSVDAVHDYSTNTSDATANDSAESGARVAVSADLAALNGNGIDIEAALANCGTEDLLREMLSQYHDSIAVKAEELQALLDAGDFAGYRIKVHALKSTSRLIGALELAEQAAYLESCADRHDEAALHARHGALIELYRSYAQKLAAFGAESANDGAGGETGASSDGEEPLTSAELTERLKTLATCADDFDIDGADAIIAELGRRPLPADFAATFEAIRICVRNVDFDGLAAVLAELKRES